MPNPLIFALSAVVLSVVGLAACSQKASDAASSAAQCNMRFSGNTSSSVAPPSCGALSSTEDAGAVDYSLEFEAQTPDIPSFDIAIDLGAAATPGAFSSETASQWSVSGTNAAGCAFIAGTDAARVGSFALMLTSVDGDAGVGSGLHGSLDLTAYVEEATGMDCGLSDSEVVHIDF
jgi:hypothetical protein